ncbi:MAG TPA: TPM domain-containing protein [Pyrinomonadaceae bacterium]|nr:TPM domain-containing protein [Pyrinomonadaceae bacterium]
MRTTLTLVVVVAALSAACQRAPQTAQQSGAQANVAAFGPAESGRENLCAQEKYSRPPVAPPAGRVGDFANILDDESERRLARRLDAFREETGVNFRVGFVKTTGAESIFDYSLALACNWGERGPRGGILLLVAAEDRRWRIQVSRDLEKDLPDDYVQEVGDEMAGRFSAGGFAEGGEFCADEFARRLSELRRRNATERRNIPTH